MLEVGRERIEAHIHHLSDLVADGMRSRGYQLSGSREGEHWSGVISFSSDRHRSEDLFQRLEERGVAISLREGLFRVSPHFYNDEEDVDRLLRALP